MSWTKPLAAPIFNRKPLSIGNAGSLPYPDAQERKKIRQRIYNQNYYRRNRKNILKQKAEKRNAK